MSNENTAIKDYCEQEGITHSADSVLSAEVQRSAVTDCVHQCPQSSYPIRDEILNAEIEEEHRKAQSCTEVQVLDLDVYTKRPVAIKAAQLTENVWNTIDENCARKIFEINGQEVQAYRRADGKKAFMLQTLEGPMQADICDWLIIGIKGEIYACKPDIFERTYQKPNLPLEENLTGIELVKLYEENRGDTAVYATDKPSLNNNSYHEFMIKYEPKNDAGKVLQRIKLQDGNFAEFGHNGIFTEHLLFIAKDCLERFNTSKYACEENTIAIQKIEEALMWIDKRMAKRVERGVYGTETV